MQVISKVLTGYDVSDVSCFARRRMQEHVLTDQVARHVSQPVATAQEQQVAWLQTGNRQENDVQQSKQQRRLLQDEPLIHIPSRINSEHNKSWSLSQSSASAPLTSKDKLPHCMCILDALLGSSSSTRQPEKILPPRTNFPVF